MVFSYLCFMTCSHSCPPLSGAVLALASVLSAEWDSEWICSPHVTRKLGNLEVRSPCSMFSFHASASDSDTAVGLFGSLCCL